MSKETRSKPKPKIKNTKPLPSTAHLSDEEWMAVASQKRRRCAVCNDSSIESIRDVLRFVNAKQAWKITLLSIYTRVCDLNPGFEDRVRVDNFRAHLDFHEPLWHYYKGDSGK